MADSTADQPSRPKAAFRPATTVTNTLGVSHGTETTVNIQHFVTPVKLEFNVPSSQNAFNLNKSHLAVIKLLKEKDSTLEIVPSKEGQEKITDLFEFPANETDYNAMFEHAVDKQPTDARKIIIKHSLITALKYSDLKFQNAKLMDNMFTNKIWIWYNQSGTLQVAALGFVQGVHPRVTHPDGFTYNLQEAIQLEMTETGRVKKITATLPSGKKQEQALEAGEVLKPEIKLEAVTRTIGCGNGDGRIKTEAFELRVPLEIRLDIKEILTRLGNKNAIPEGRFILYGLVQTVGAEVYKKMLHLQNDYLTNFRMIPVFGITPQAIKHIFNTFEEDGTEQQMTIQNSILSKECIHGIETTNRAKDLGKLFLISDAIGIIAARAFVDTVIKEIFETPDTIPPELIHPNFNPPRRGDAPCTSATFNHTPQPWRTWAIPKMMPHLSVASLHPLDLQSATLLLCFLSGPGWW
jgi:hypothetical protein